MTGDEDEKDDEQSDPRQGGEWKIQKKTGFQKDREAKAKVKAGKLSKTAKRNSNEPLVADVDVDEDVDMFEFLDQMMSSDKPVVPMPVVPMPGTYITYKVKCKNVFIK